jgi:hypothetical protein
VVEVGMGWLQGEEDGRSNPFDRPEGRIWRLGCG